MDAFQSATTSTSASSGSSGSKDRTPVKPEKTDAANDAANSNERSSAIAQSDADMIDEIMNDDTLFNPDAADGQDRWDWDADGEQEEKALQTPKKRKKRAASPNIKRSSGKKS